MRLKRGIGPLDLPGQCGRVPFGRVHASYSSSTEEFGNCMFVIFHLERKTLLALTTRVWKSVLVHSPERSRWGRRSGFDIYLVRSVDNGSVYDYTKYKHHRCGRQEMEKEKNE